MASRVAQRDAKRQLSNGKKENGKTTTLIVTHGFPTLLKQNPAYTLSESRTTALYCWKVLQITQMYKYIVLYFADDQAIYTLPQLFDGENCRYIFLSHSLMLILCYTCLYV